MEIVWDGRTYEGVHAVHAMAMAVMEESGIRRLMGRQHGRAQTLGRYGREGAGGFHDGEGQDGHNDRVQLNLSHVVGGNGTPLCSR